MGRWKEGLLFDGIAPTPGLKSAANWFPRTEKVGPDEIRIIFMGTSPMIRPGQMNTSILVQLGNGENFVLDLGEGSIANYIASGIALNENRKSIPTSTTRRGTNPCSSKTGRSTTISSSTWRRSHPPCWRAWERPGATAWPTTSTSRPRTNPANRLTEPESTAVSPTNRLR